MGDTELEGRIEQVLDENQFILNGCTIVFDQYTVFKNGTRINIEVGTKVEVEGYIDSTGDFIAREIEFDD